MKLAMRPCGVGVVFGALTLMSGMPRAAAQMALSGGGRSLGGYGASAGSSMGSGGGAYLPSMGRASGFVPYSGSSGGGLGAQPIPRRLSTMSIGGTKMADSPIGGASIQPMGTGRSGMALGAGAGRRALIPPGYEGGFGMGATSMGGMSARRPYGPGFGYPFQMPSTFSGSSSMSTP